MWNAESVSLSLLDVDHEGSAMEYVVVAQAPSCVNILQQLDMSYGVLEHDYEKKIWYK